METFAATVEDALMNNRDLLPAIATQAKKFADATRYFTPTQAIPASFPPTVEVYHELSLNRIIVEIQAHDQIGLLYRLVKAISDHGYDTTFARISTERSVAIDTFYIEPDQPSPSVDTARLHTLRDTLRAIITPLPVA
jgi:[protein-PII] uridylyltransferase